MIQSHPGKKEKSRCRLTTLKHFSVGKLQLPSWKTLATHALNIHKHTSSLVSTWPIETYVSVVNQHQATYETQSYLTQFTNSSIKYQHTSINQQIKRNTGSKKHIGLTHLPLFCRSLSQFHLHAANRVWL